MLNVLFFLLCASATRPEGSIAPTVDATRFLFVCLGLRSSTLPNMIKQISYLHENSRLSSVQLSCVVYIYEESFYSTIYRSSSALLELCEVKFNEGYFAQHMLKVKTQGYDYIGVSMDDVDFQLQTSSSMGKEEKKEDENIDLESFIQAMRTYRLDLAAPASKFLSNNANPFWYLKQNKSCGIRKTKHVELQFNVFNVKTFIKYQQMLKKYLHLNPLGWGFDLIFPYYFHDVNIGVLNFQVVGIGGNDSSESSYSHQAAYDGLLFLLSSVFHHGKLTSAARSHTKLEAVSLSTLAPSKAYTASDTSAAVDGTAANDTERELLLSVGLEWLYRLLATAEDEWSCVEQSTEVFID